MDTRAFRRSPFALPLSVVVVSADSGPALRECVQRVLTSSMALELLLIDNRSQDGVPQAIERAYAHDGRLRVIYNHSNLGFGAAVNVASRQAQGDALLVLNPDCIVEDGQLQHLVGLLSDKPKVGLIGAVVCDADGRADPASWRRDPLLARSLNSLLHRAGEKVNMEGEIPAELIESEAVSGALMMMPRALFQRMGGFDEAYFLHCEDLDLCRRVRDIGYQVLLAGDVRVLHGKGSSSRHRPVFVSRHKHRGMWQWFRKHDPAAARKLVSAAVWLGIWTHFVLQIPGQWWRLLVLKARRSMQAADRAGEDD